MHTHAYTHTSGVSSLNHKLLDDTMKDVTIVVAITTVYTEVLHCLRAPNMYTQIMYSTPNIHTNTYCSTNSLICISPIDVCTVAVSVTLFANEPYK